MEVCRICNKEFTNLMSHVRNKHKMGKDEYIDFCANPIEEEVFEEEVIEEEVIKEVIGEVVVNTGAPDDSINDNTILKALGGMINNTIEDKLAPILKEFKIDEDKLRVILAAYFKNDKSGDVVNKVNELKDLKRVHAHTVEVAEDLVTNHGFTVQEVQGKTKSRKKTWILTK